MDHLMHHLVGRSIAYVRERDLLRLWRQRETEARRPEPTRRPEPPRPGPRRTVVVGPRPALA